MLLHNGWWFSTSSILLVTPIMTFKEYYLICQLLCDCYCCTSLQFILFEIVCILQVCIVLLVLLFSKSIFCTVLALFAFSALTLLIGRQVEHLSCKRLSDNLHVSQQMPLPSHRLLLRLNPDWFNLSGARLPRLSCKRGRVCWHCYL